MLRRLMSGRYCDVGRRGAGVEMGWGLFLGIRELPGGWRLKGNYVVLLVQLV